jgi:hypothetical protein
MRLSHELQRGRVPALGSRMRRAAWVGLGVVTAPCKQTRQSNRFHSAVDGPVQQRRKNSCAATTQPCHASNRCQRQVGVSGAMDVPTEHSDPAHQPSEHVKAYQGIILGAHITPEGETNREAHARPGQHVTIGPATQSAPLNCPESPVYSRQRHGAHNCQETSETTGRPRTTMPISFRSAADTSSTVSSNTRFMNWSNPRKIPVILRFAFNLMDNFFSMNFLSSGMGTCLTAAALIRG